MKKVSSNSNRSLYELLTIMVKYAFLLCLPSIILELFPLRSPLFWESGGCCGLAWILLQKNIISQKELQTLMDCIDNTRPLKGELFFDADYADSQYYFKPGRWGIRYRWLKYLRKTYSKK